MEEEDINDKTEKQLDNHVLSEVEEKPKKETEKKVIIDLKDVELSRDRSTILQNINLKVLNGDFLYLIGKVGSGKSTFMKSLYCEIPLRSGEGNILGYNLGSMKQKQVPYLRRKIGIIFQDFQLLIDRSANKNLEFVLRATGWSNQAWIDQRIEEVLAQVGMEKKGYKMPHELSGGEQQRIVIARALLNSPDLILADEPTGNLDPDTGNQIVQLLQNISKDGTTVIMSTHNYAIVQKYPGRILKCDDGTMNEVRISKSI